eukprot:scaffold875_cov185-Amphora_coffeaeformis.AAC.1
MSKQAAVALAGKAGPSVVVVAAAAMLLLLLEDDNRVVVVGDRVPLLLLDLVEDDDGCQSVRAAMTKTIAVIIQLVALVLRRKERVMEGFDFRLVDVFVVEVVLGVVVVEALEWVKMKGRTCDHYIQYSSLMS